MDFLGDNPIANMDRVQFLLLYVAIIVVVLALARWIPLRWDRSGRLPEPLSPVPFHPDPLHPDPHEVAYLRGGEPELISLIAVDLTLRDYLEQMEKRVRIKPRHPDPGDLTASERAVFDAVKGDPSVDADSLRGSTTLNRRIESLCEPYYRKAQADRLLMPGRVSSVAWIVGLVAAAIIVGLAVYEIVVSFSAGDRRLGGTFAIAFFATLALFLVVVPPRISARGRAYLQSLQRTFEPLRKSTALSTVDARIVRSDLVLLTAVFGSDGLTGASKLGGLRGALLLLGFLVVLAVAVQALWGSGLSEADKHFNAGVEFQQQGRLEDAVFEYDEAMRVDPEYNDSALYFNRATAYRKLGQFQRAIEDLDRALLLPVPRLNGKDDESLLGLRFYYYDHIRLVRGTAYLDLGRADRAIEDLDRSIKSYSSFSGWRAQDELTDAYIQRGRAYRFLGQQERAIEDYTKALFRMLLSPHPEVFAYRCEASNELGEYRKAMGDCNRAIDTPPPPPTFGIAYRSRGNVFYSQGLYARATQDYETAIDLYNAAIRLDPTDADAYFGRALTHTALGNEGQAQRDSELAVEYGASPVLLEYETLKLTEHR